MTDTQLWIAVGAPVLFNGLGFTLLILYMDARFDAIDKRFELMEKVWVLDARLKHLEEEKRP